jgi:Tfp pilus assembly protein FimT
MTRNTGFTLVDVVATVSVLGIVVTIAIPAFSTWLTMRRVDVARKVLMGGLATARTGGGNQTNIGETPSETGHGQFVRCISDLTNELKKAGIISGKEKGAIQSLAAKAKLAP